MTVRHCSADVVGAGGFASGAPFLTLRYYERIVFTKLGM